jgi:hypothetical protein
MSFVIVLYCTFVVVQKVRCNFENDAHDVDAVAIVASKVARVSLLTQTEL